MAETQELCPQINLQEYFREHVRRAIVNQHIELTEDSEFYVVNLLTELKKSEKLFQTVDGKPDDTPLALLLERAMHSDTTTRVRTLKFLGDTALFVAGIFPERATRRFQTLDYYIRMGGGAYLSLASNMTTQRNFAEVFEEMGCKFRNLVSLLNEVGKSGREHSDLDLLDCYERFLATGDHRLREILQRAGIMTPIKIITPQ
jgi:hypothetical protein